MKFLNGVGQVFGSLDFLPCLCCGARIQNGPVGFRNRETSRWLEREASSNLPPTYVPSLGISIGSEPTDKRWNKYIVDHEINAHSGRPFYISSVHFVDEDFYGEKDGVISYGEHTFDAISSQFFCGIVGNWQGVKPPDLLFNEWNSLERNTYLFYIPTNSQLEDFLKFDKAMDDHRVAKDNGIPNLNYLDVSPRLNWYLYYKE